MKLEKHELLSPVWLKIEAEMTARLQRYREQNDSPMGKMTNDDTMWLRGKLELVKEIIGWAHPPDSKDAPG